ncbi:MAG: bifunctional diaminohydroxyphosphoribosylaminopyrimidine deaminase/5-amino-6-(5-phosphoribosylamino)uracil reductase RibD [Tatlockia sp.]|nr:bifunctional diaminohydroxyphosphoribosylaminopyrimidine deaminase/5-amino-6-(5-phosphoribosylamino)uracil reductase RibD [Tatlockia sp.]
MHTYFMQAALEQAWLGRGKCAPNPSVGAVAVYKGKIIAKGWHRGAGTAHAEQLVLDQIPAGLEDLVLYVTLEPCNHWGKTPPCVTGIVQYGVAQVVYGFTDPNPIVAANNTPQLLRDHGLDVVHFPLPEVNDFYESYCYWIKTKKPWITAKLAQSLDGKIGEKGSRVYLTNQACAEFTHQKRASTDVILTTEKTIKADDPLFNARVSGQEQGKILAILDSRLLLSADAKMFSKAAQCHIYYDENLRVENPQKNCSYHPAPANKGLLDLTFIVNHLGGLGYHDIWVEAGGKLFSAMHRDKLVQRTYLYIAPEVLGEEAISAFEGDEIFKNKLKISWQIKADNVIACIDLQESLCSQEL